MRLDQVSWILDHKRDLMADFRALYHLAWADAIRLPSEEFLALCHRTPAYPGVMQLRAMEEERAERRNVPVGAQLVDGTREAVTGNPLLADVVEFG